MAERGGSGVVPLRWSGEALWLLDQRRLPRREAWLRYRSSGAVARAITAMVVRGAPAIGITAAFGLVLAAGALRRRGRAAGLAAWRRRAAVLAAARPTAVNLAWAVRRLEARLAGGAWATAAEARRLLEAEALAAWREDFEANLAMGAHGAALLPARGTVLTHCNAGALATGGYGTALGVIRAARAAGKDIRVLADETRPWLQGARLTAWELARDGIPVTLLADGAAGHHFRQGRIQAVVVGADRIAANGDVANKIGTYTVAVLARQHGVPFYVAAPTSTLDPGTASGDAIPIEERPGEEVTACAGRRVAPPGVPAANPAFDVTPAELVTAIVTERGVLRPPYGAAIRRLLGAAGGEKRP
ncbi:S-methyl-5-thioribose-1-phosphate isomerase [Dissulfurirhabdus thermomarina]|uniref:Methylthioribose-1-phosphate isomerase n=1 Tax=Dissulfurirhabdus thermomarina TaxID=1765737 RepID=A0A6N9TLM2_DISTH|nr:S-methyl-5-thioribose-1-phosphate isomerase [Dissulfurirhabdus thermomarina]